MSFALTNEEIPVSTILMLDEAYQRWTGEPLPGPSGDPEGRARWIHLHAPYSLVSHDTQGDPHFIYANECALRCFKYSRDEFCAMRFSASSIDREQRQALLTVVTQKGFASGYTGYRVDRQGQPFTIHDGIVWEVLDTHEIRRGQAALFWPHPAPTGRTIQDSLT